MPEFNGSPIPGCSLKAAKLNALVRAAVINLPSRYASSGRNDNLKGESLSSRGRGDKQEARDLHVRYEIYGVTTRDYVWTRNR